MASDKLQALMDAVRIILMPDQYTRENRDTTTAAYVALKSALASGEVVVCHANFSRSGVAPCPFCGGDGKLTGDAISPRFEIDHDPTCYLSGAPNCDEHGHISDQQRPGILRKWNTRTNCPRLPR